jgi:diacylglycerol O-acyltransferase / wax synthase
MLEWHPYVPISQGVRVSTAILSYAGRLGFGVTSDYDTFPDPSLLARGS